MKDITVSVAEHDLENLIEAYHTLSANAEVVEFAAGIMGQMVVRLEATSKRSIISRAYLTKKQSARSLSTNLNDITVSVGNNELLSVIEAYHTLSDKADELSMIGEEANAEVMEFAAGIMGQMLMRLEATGKISGPCLYSPEFTIN